MLQLRCHCISTCATLQMCCGSEAPRSRSLWGAERRLDARQANTVSSPCCGQPSSATLRVGTMQLSLDSSILSCRRRVALTISLRDGSRQPGSHRSHLQPRSCTQASCTRQTATITMTLRIRPLAAALQPRCAAMYCTCTLQAALHMQ